MLLLVTKILKENPSSLSWRELDTHMVYLNEVIKTLLTSSQENWFRKAEEGKGPGGDVGASFSGEVSTLVVRLD